MHSKGSFLEASSEQEKRKKINIGIILTSVPLLSQNNEKKRKEVRNFIEYIIVLIPPFFQFGPVVVNIFHNHYFSRRKFL